MTANRLKPDSLAAALLGAAGAVARVRTGTALPQALAAIDAPPNVRGAIQDIAYRSMRSLGRTEALLARLASKPPPPLLHGLLCCALGLLSSPDDDAGRMPYDAFTVVDQAVDAAAAAPETAAAKGMVNAVLRRFLRERAALLDAVLQQPPACWNYPAWWIDATRSAYPQDWEAILHAGNALPPLTLRVNRRRTTAAAYL